MAGGILQQWTTCTNGARDLTGFARFSQLMAEALFTYNCIIVIIHLVSGKGTFKLIHKRSC